MISFYDYSEKISTKKLLSKGELRSLKSQDYLEAYLHSLSNLLVRTIRNLSHKLFA